ncbi:hypothetical protein DPMN_049280 [Dreissena polymorpha]|uniref:Tyr recombinase domain-containing protein n=1 Tax=Dreissena polymorpha TaxID=45954 RepID=A0A9D4HKC4_DREPO|nr:hypothetical protein DPMN_049280 [Dreissena polymorpha]
MTLHPGDSCVNNWMLKAMAKDAGFLKHKSLKRIMNHSVRKFLVQKLRNANITPTETMAITGHKNSSKCNNPTDSSCSPSCTETVAEMRPRQPLSTVEQVDLDVRPTQSLHQQMSL